MNMEHINHFLAFADNYQLPEGKTLTMTYWMECGTSGCAIGWYIWNGIPPDGFRMDKTKGGDFSYYHPTYHNKTGMVAVSEYFGIPFLEADIIFGMANADKDFSTVASRMRRVLNVD